VHHGDGVETIFYSDPGVLTVSLHESGRFLFPGTGFVEDVGVGDAEGTSINVPLFPGTKDDDYLQAFFLDPFMHFDQFLLELFKFFEIKTLIKPFHLGYFLVVVMLILLAHR
jgi:acetoin utilization deacetylase AcuC-like enzyme